MSTFEQNPIMQTFQKRNKNCKILIRIGTSETLLVGSPFIFFRANLKIPQPETKIAIISKRLKVET